MTRSLWSAKRWLLKPARIVGSFGGRPVAEPVGPHLRRHAGEPGRAVEGERAGGVVGVQDRPRGEAGGAGLRVRHVAAGERPGLDGLVADVEVHQALAPVGPLAEVG
jgi:hypothetical protein